MKHVFNRIKLNNSAAQLPGHNLCFLTIGCIYMLVTGSNAAFSQQTAGVTLTGSFYDATSGNDLPAKVYGIKNGSGTFEGEAHPNGNYTTYSIRLQKGMDSLLFESADYHPKRFPLHFHGNFRNDVQDEIDIETFKLDKPDLAQRYVIFAEPENSKNYYNVIHYRDNELHCEQSKVVPATHGVLERDFVESNSRYIVQVLSADDAVVSEVEYQVLPGINIVDLSAYPQSAPITEPHEFSKSGIPVVYFEQSKYELTETAQKLLEEVLVYLKQKPAQKLQVKGYTDGVGDTGLNEALARYRARVVAHYLTGHGVPEANVLVEWENKNTEAKADLNAFRKVTITEIQ
jgi:outer membrane protein OmpA-like peptidoglycan-associated protein